jgi:hypothetical protein
VRRLHEANPVYDTVPETAEQPALKQTGRGTLEVCYVTTKMLPGLATGIVAKICAYTPTPSASTGC